jgi:hypothetical protein
VDDKRFPPENIELDGIFKVENPKYKEHDKKNPEHWHYYTIVRNNKAPGMQTKRAEAQEAAKKAMEAKGLKDDKKKKDAVDAALGRDKALEFLSDGPRGKLYLLKKGYEHILGAAITMGIHNGRRWALHGIGEKSIRGCYLLLALPM